MWNFLVVYIESTNPCYVPLDSVERDNCLREIRDRLGFDCKPDWDERIGTLEGKYPMGEDLEITQTDIELSNYIWRTHKDFLSRFYPSNLVLDSN